MLEEEKLDELDIALLRQMEREALLETVYDERRLSDAEIKTLLNERSVRALAEIRRILDEDTPDETCFEKIERVIKVYEAIGADAAHVMIFKTSVKPAQRLKASARVFSRQDKRRA